MKHWKILNKQIFTPNTPPKKLVEVLLANRGITSREDIKNFIKADIKSVGLESSGIDKKEYLKFEKRIDSAIKNEERIVIFGDYDVDGICASAILWETLFSKTKKVTPYIPDRLEEGYGLSIKGIDSVLGNNPDTKIIITVDNGIVAYEAVKYAKEKGIDVIVTDHHVKGGKSPDAFCILHTTSLCGAGIAWVLSAELQFETKEKIYEKLELAALATVADLVPLIGDNRAIVKAGLEILRNTKRAGLIELLKDAQIEKEDVKVYTIGHIIAPRLNATGRIQSAMNSLRLICTTNEKKARELAGMLSNVNKDRQDLTQDSVEHAKMLSIDTNYSNKIIVVSDESYNQGIIGLIASRLVENYYKPSFAIAKGEILSKGSARSITGVNIIELLRSVGDVLDEAGGHPMAAGFSIKTEKIDEFILALSKKAEKIVTDELLKRYLTIDMYLPFQALTFELYDQIMKLEPFGMANQEPVFATKKVMMQEVRKIGKEKTHLKLKLEKDGKVFDAVAFRFADKLEIDEGDQVDIAYTLDDNKWNGKISLQLKIRDMQLTETN